MAFLSKFRSPVLFCAISLATLVSACKKQEDVGTTDTTSSRTASSYQAIPSKPVPGFEANRAFKDIETQVAFGPRVPNSPSHEKQLSWLKQQLDSCTSSVQLQHFTSAGYKTNEVLQLTNVLASFNPEAKQRVLILSHWDSRPWADSDPNASNQSKAVPAANDGGSGTAVMLELARQFKNNPPPIGVDLLFDDGEDYGKYDVDSLERYFLGVKYYVENRGGYNPMFAILLDMVGDKNANFTTEGNSMQAAQRYTQEVWNTAQSLKLSAFKMHQGPMISDDHIPLLQAGIPSVDIIDGDLVGHASPLPDRAYWHTTDDVMKHLSPDTIDQVGRLLLTLIYDRIPKDLPSL